MGLADLLMILSFGAPLFISLISIGILVAQRRAGNNSTKRKLLALSVGYFASVFVSDFTVILFIFEWNIYIYTSPFSFLSLTMSVVFFYHIIFILTSADGNKRFPVFHYLIPVLLTVAHMVWSLFMPYQVQYDIVANRILDTDNYKWFCYFYTSKLWVYALYVVVYALLILRRMPAYRIHITNFSADEEKSSLRWLYTIIFLSVIILPIAFITFFLKGRGSVSDEVIALMANVLYCIQLITLQYNLFMENYVVMSEDGNEIKKGNVESAFIDKKDFEYYIRHKKPFLNPHLKITDMLYEFHTCRSYMSAFINRTYGMNFSRFINSLRMEEFNKLRNNPDNAAKSEAELIASAGFSYRGFMRYRKSSSKNARRG